MSWSTILGLSVGAYAFKALGLVALSRVPGVRRFTDLVALLPPALLMALVVTQTLQADGGGVTVDERLAGLAVGAVAVALRAPFLVVVVASAATAALLRAIG